MEQPLAVNAENSRAKVQNVGGDSSAFLFGLSSVACRREDSNETTRSSAKRSTKAHKGEG
ncbi:MAG: hypothetical protein DMG40_02860 [Acidobacteria bacterium]|nr:MAG: hypothetical protein DMG40_02860 [Acidobacteriota bacterium]